MSREFPDVYPYPAEIARQKGELSLFRENNRLNADCAKAIHAAIRAHYSNSHLDTGCVDAVLSEYGAERVQWVLAHTLQQMDYDGRFSRNNKEWAKGFDIPQMEYSGFVVETHPAVLDGFIKLLRSAVIKKEIQPAQTDAEPGEYKYYAVHRPVDIGTIPREPKPEKVYNFDWRMPVENGTFEAWGSITYKQPLTEKQIEDYELRAAASNPCEKASVLDSLKEKKQAARPSPEKKAPEKSGPEL